MADYVDMWKKPTQYYKVITLQLKINNLKKKNYPSNQTSQMALVVKNSPVSTGDIRDPSSILGPEDPVEEGMATHSNILAWRTPKTEEPGGLQSTGSQRV